MVRHPVTVVVLALGAAQCQQHHDSSESLDSEETEFTTAPTNPSQPNGQSLQLGPQGPFHWYPTWVLEGAQGAKRRVDTLSRQGALALLVFGPHAGVALGRQGRVEVFDGRAWTRKKTPCGGASGRFVAAWGRSTDDFWASCRHRDAQIEGLYQYTKGQWTKRADVGCRDLWKAPGGPLYGIQEGKVGTIGRGRWEEIGVDAEVTFRKVHGTSKDNIWLLGTPRTRALPGEKKTNVLAHFDGRRWTKFHHASFRLSDVWAASPNEAWAVGARGSAIRWDGGRWREVDVPTEANLLRIWGNAANDVWAVGSQSTLLHFDGRAWAAVSLGEAHTPKPRLKPEFTAIAGLGDHTLIIAASTGAFFHGRMHRPKSWVQDAHISAQALAFEGKQSMLAGEWAHAKEVLKRCVQTKKDPRCGELLSAAYSLGPQKDGRRAMESLRAVQKQAPHRAGTYRLLAAARASGPEPKPWNFLEWVLDEDRRVLPDSADYPGALSQTFEAILEARAYLLGGHIARARSTYNQCIHLMACPKVPGRLLVESIDSRTGRYRRRRGRPTRPRPGSCGALPLHPACQEGIDLIKQLERDDAVRRLAPSARKGYHADWPLDMERTDWIRWKLSKRPNNRFFHEGACTGYFRVYAHTPLTAPPGAEVTLKGRGFPTSESKGSGLEISLGGKMASFHRQSATRLRFTVPGSVPGGAIRVRFGDCMAVWARFLVKKAPSTKNTPLAAQLKILPDGSGRAAVNQLRVRFRSSVTRARVNALVSKWEAQVVRAVVRTKTYTLHFNVEPDSFSALEKRRQHIESAPEVEITMLSQMTREP